MLYVSATYPLMDPNIVSDHKGEPHTSLSSFSATAAISMEGSQYGRLREGSTD